MRISVLDHGYVEFIEAWGTGKGGRAENTEDNPDRDDYECGIIEAARQSTQCSFRGWDEDKKLLDTLFHHQANQSTPFEAAGMTLEVQAPIFVFREWHRHRTQSYNEASARYTPLPDLYYIPDGSDVERRMYEAAQARNRQAGSMAHPRYAYIAEWLEDIRDLYRQSEAVYRAALENGIPKELARITMPVGHYSRMRATANLRNWLHFLTLRTEANAQQEIRQFAGAVAEIVGIKFPHTYELWVQVSRG